MKIVSYSKDVTSQMIGKYFYMISLEEVRLVKALVDSYENSTNAGYGGANQQAGTKNNTEKNNSTLKGLFLIKMLKYIKYSFQELQKVTLCKK